MDLAGVAACFPGATVTSVEGDRFEGTCKVKLGPIALLYAGSGQFVTRDDDAHRATIEATGKDKRGNGTAGAKVTIALDEAADSSTAVEVTTDLNITGKPAQFGRGVMQDVSDKLLHAVRRLPGAAAHRSAAGRPRPRRRRPRRFPTEDAEPDAGLLQRVRAGVGRGGGRVRGGTGGRPLRPPPPRPLERRPAGLRPSQCG